MTQIDILETTVMKLEQLIKSSTDLSTVNAATDILSDINQYISSLGSENGDDIVTGNTSASSCKAEFGALSPAELIENRLQMAMRRAMR